MSSLYAPYAIRYETDAMSGTPALLGGITKQSISAGSEESQEAVAGAAYPLWVGLTGQKVMAEFTSRNIETALTYLTPPCAVLAGVGVQQWQVKRTDGVVTAGATHRHADIADGIVVPRRLVIPADGHAEISYQVLARYDGTNAPLLFTETAALPAETLADVARWAMGSYQVGSIALDGNLNMEIDFGVKAEQIQTDGDVWAKYLDVSDYLAKITVRSVGTEQIADAGIPLVGKAAAHADSFAYIRQRDGGGFTAGSQHIKITFDGLCYADDVYDASGNQRGECSLITILKFDGTNAPLTFAMNEALP